MVVSPSQAITPSDATLISTQRIWNAAAYNSFTDLEFFNGQFYAVFREASQHGVPPAGTQGGEIRILRSSNGSNWSSVGLLNLGIDNDLRDPKLSVTPDNRLMVLASDTSQTGAARQTYSWFSSDGTNWESKNTINVSPRWMWRVEWDGSTAYGVSYSGNSTELSKSTDGVSFTTVVPTLTTGNEEGLIYRNDGSAVMLVRRDGTGATAVVGTSSGNFTSWNWVNTSRFVGGPDLIQLPDGRMVAAGRLTDGTERTSLMFLNPSTGSLNEFMTLPSGGDTGYPGLVWQNQTLWVSYYSSQEGKASIYLSQVKFANVPEPGTAVVALLGVSLGLGRTRCQAGVA